MLGKDLNMQNSTRYPFWKLAELEQTLDARSRAGQQVCRADLRMQTYAGGPGAFWHRVGWYSDRPGSALRRIQELQQQSAGWEPVCSSGAYTVYRRPVADGAKPALQGGNEAYCAHLAAIIRRLEAVRNTCFAVTLLPLLAGYAADRAAITRLAALPLLVALALTYAVKYISQGKLAAEA